MYSGNWGPGTLVTVMLTGRARPASLPNEKFSTVGSWASSPRCRFGDFVLRGEIQQNGHQVDACNTVDHAMVDFRDDHEPSGLQTLNDVELPERLRPIELLGHESAREILELISRTRVRKRYMPEVIVEMKVLVIDPDWVAFQGDCRDALSIPRDHVEAGQNDATNRLNVHNNSLPRISDHSQTIGNDSLCGCTCYVPLRHTFWPFTTRC